MDCGSTSHVVTATLSLEVYSLKRNKINRKCCEATHKRAMTMTTFVHFYCVHFLMIIRILMLLVWMYASLLTHQQCCLFIVLFVMGISLILWNNTNFTSKQHLNLTSNTISKIPHKSGHFLNLKIGRKLWEFCNLWKTVVFTKEMDLLMTQFLRKNSTF